MASALLELLLVLGTVLGIQVPGVREAASTVSTGTVVFVYDGDTALVRIGTTTERVRFLGIDAPERNYDDPSSGDCYAEAAAVASRELLLGKEVIVAPDEENRDRYGRLLRYLYLDGVFVNELLVREGYARMLTIAPNTKYRAILDAAEIDARDAARGLWGTCMSG